jgi:hypothetical protein
MQAYKERGAGCRFYDSRKRGLGARGKRATHPMVSCRRRLAAIEKRFVASGPSEELDPLRRTEFS